MLLTILGAATLTAAPLPEASGLEPAVPELSAEYLGRRWKDGVQQAYERYDIRLSNNTEEAKLLRMCPQDAFLRYKKTRVIQLHARAIGVDDEAWDHNCINRELVAGDSVELSVFFGVNNRLAHSRRLNVARPVTLLTSLGTLHIIDEKVVLVADAGTLDAQRHDS